MMGGRGSWGLKPFNLVLTTVIITLLCHHHAEADLRPYWPNPPLENSSLFAPDGYPPHCGDPSSCDREVCNDQRDYAPPTSRSACPDHTDVMQCFRNCKDPGPVRTCYNERKKNDTQEFCLLRYARSILQVNTTKVQNSTLHLGLPCTLKCKVDPGFWGCVHACDNKGCFSSFRKCEREGSPPPCTNTTSKYWAVEACKDCYISELVEEVPKSLDCIIRYTTASTSLEDDLDAALELAVQPDLCVYGDGVISEDKDTTVAKDIERCVAQLSSKPNMITADVGVIEECFRKRLMWRQMVLCTQVAFTDTCGGTGRTVKSRICHEHCFHILTKPYCTVPCVRNVQLREECEEDCKINWPSVQCVCSRDAGNGSLTEIFMDEEQRLEEYINRTATCRDKRCYARNIYVPTNELNINTVKLQNCKSNWHVAEFAKRLANISNPNEMEEGVSGPIITFDSNIGNFSDHYSYYECQVMVCTWSFQMIECIEECVRTRRDSSEMDKVCDESKTANRFANFLRSEILLGCIVSRSMEQGIEIEYAFDAYISLIIEQPEEFQKLYACEKLGRDMSKNEIEAEMWAVYAGITYQLDMLWCQNCSDPTIVDNIYHIDDLNHAKCALKCYERKDKLSCPRLKSTENAIEGITDTKCSWKIDYSLTRKPSKIWKSYFDEVAPFDVSSTLQEPNTEQYLLKTSIGETEGHFVFPYFVVVRPICENGYYDDEVYKFIASGATPFVKLTYLPISSRASNQKVLRATLQAALINLMRKDEEDDYLEHNKLELKINKTDMEQIPGGYGCHMDICYPAFVLPQVMLHMPIFAITVFSQGTFVQTDTWGYSATLHSRESSGVGKMKLNDDRDTPTAMEYFPHRKTVVYEDTQFAGLWNRLPDSGYVQGSDPNSKARPGPELGHLTDVNCREYKPQETLTIGGNANLPLDNEDFMRVQYTHGNAPQVVMAGFYDPNLVLVGDPDFINTQLTRWNFESTSGTKDKPTARIFNGRYSCLSQHYKVGRFKKPIYSYVDRSDPDYWLTYYRMRYAPKNYENASEAKAIFDTIALEDRILLVTTDGLVSLYQNLNTTASLGKAWEVENADRLEKCFKIVRTARRTQQHSDTIVAITYDYQVTDTTNNIIEDVNQEVWVGKYFNPGKPLVWKQIVGGSDEENVKEVRDYNIGGDKLGNTMPLPSHKLMDSTTGHRENNPKSQIDAICYKAYRSKMGLNPIIELVEEYGWCNAIDATPVNSADSVIQVLVRMRVYYSGGGGGDVNLRRHVFFYVVASYDISQTSSQKANWEINSIIPRIPCKDEHKEAIPGVKAYATNYFRSNSSGETTKGHGCYTNEYNSREEFTLYLHGITYTKSYTQHLFVYGNSLLQSTDSGQTFVHLKSFPLRGADDEYKCTGSGSAYHTIKLMTFDTKGHYAFLTNKRELWYGSLGSLSQIRLRPDDAHSMVTTKLYEVRELQDAIPFSLFFDSNNELIEMVAVVDTHGAVLKIARRSINEKSILRASHFLDKFAETAAKHQAKLKKELMPPPEGKGKVSISKSHAASFKYDHIDWSMFCPYASASVWHNFSVKHARVLTFSFPNPMQHLELGNSHGTASLHTYQASTFRIMWNAFLNAPETLYTSINTDLFGTWVKEKTDYAVIGRMNYLNNYADQFGVMVHPTKYQRYNRIPEDEYRMFNFYYMDYGIIIQMHLEYSVSNDYTFNPVNYLHHHLAVIDINVENSNGSLIQIDTDREVIAAKAAVRYVVHIKVKQNTGLQQRLSGRDGIRIPVTFHLVDGFGKCIPSETTGIQGDSISTEVVVGCPVSQELVLDWKSTVNTIKFRDHQAHYGLSPSECFAEELFCFYVKYPLILKFQKFDSVKLVHHNYTGKYVMRIIGGGYSRESIRDYSEEEQQAFNIPGVSDVSLIWNEWDIKAHQKVERKNISRTTGRNDSREVVLTSGDSSIQWACHTLSPCARILPTSSLESVFYIKIFISNRGVDFDTLCLFEKEFVILLYGFPPSTEMQLITTMIFYFVMVMFVYIAYFCARSDRKVWRSVTEKIQGWLQVVVDALPKSWTKSEEEEEEETELQKQRRRDEIILSLQGHLNVPRMVHKATLRSTVSPKDAVKRKRKEAEMSPTSSTPSDSSSSSGNSNNQGLNPIISRPEAQTWTDMIYEQIISRRLAAIIERNKQDAEELKRKTAIEKRMPK